MLNIKPLRAERVTVLASLFLLIGFNSSLWSHLSTITSSDITGLLLRASFAVMVACLFNIALTVIAFRSVFKAILITLFMISSAIAYFMNQYGIMIDIGMLRNTAETNTTEVLGLVSPLLFVYVLLLGVLPSWLLYKTPIAYRPWHKELMFKGLAGVGCAVVFTGVALLNYQGLSSLLRNHHELRLMVTPSNYLGATFSYLREQVSSAKQSFVKIAEDAHRTSMVSTSTRKSLTVLVIGESARAENFGLLGYARNTTPQLEREQDVIAFSDVHSCGTETAVSVPCMFSGMGRQQYNAAIAKNREGLLDVLQRAGLDVIWRDNQSGCKGTCDRVQVQDVSNLTDPALCADNECRDAIVLRDLQADIDNLKNDTVLVLHQMGSHGPEYYKRYPSEFERFTPVCKSNALNNCSRESIVNAYDNTLLYTDHVLASLIDTLRRNQDKVDTSMLYVSDHGESLGEYNLFLHGTPYMLAPEQQRRVPMLAWFSDNYRTAQRVDTTCLQQNRNAPLSHDNLFHSMLGLLGVSTHVYDRGQDLFAQCRKPQVVSAS